MKKSILNLGKALHKAEQQTISGGKYRDYCNDENPCPPGQICYGWACFA